VEVRSLKKTLYGEDLAVDIEATIDAIQNILELDENYVAEFQRTIDTYLSTHLFIAFVLSSILSIILAYALSPFKYWTWFFTGVFVFYIVAVGQIEKVFVKKRIEAKKDIYLSYPREREKLIDMLRMASSVPEAYWHVQALQIMRLYVINGRADTIKEAINLLEHEIRVDQQLQSLRNIEKQLAKPQVGYFIEF